MNKSLKIYLYSGNHRKLIGIKEYINYFKILSIKFHFQLHIGDNLSNKASYDFVIFIEEFSHPIEFIKIFFFLKKYPKKGILFLTEFFNTNSRTLNNFEYNNKYFNFFFSINAINIFLILLIKIFFGGIRKIISNIYNFITYILKSLLKLFVKRFAVSIISAFSVLSNKQKLFRHLDNLYSKYHNIFYYKLRFSTLQLLISNFNIYLRSHESIKFKTIKKIITIFFFLKSDNFKLVKNKEFAFEFSGELNKYRKNQIKKIISNKKMYKNINAKFIKKIEQKNYGFYSFLSKQYNFLSLHFKKSNSWPYCSPTRYINSLNKNYIPIILDKFEDEVSKLLAVNISQINSKSKIFLLNLQDKINKNIKVYNKKTNLVANSVYDSMRKIK